MAHRKDDTPSVATYADHEVITPPHELRKVVSQAVPGDDDPVARAEAALAGLSCEFSTWMQSECERLEKARAGHQARWALPKRRTTSCSAPPTTSRAKPPPSAIRKSPALPKACAGCSSIRRT